MPVNPEGKGKGAKGVKSGQRNLRSRRVIGGKKTRATNTDSDTTYTQTVRNFGRTRIVTNKKKPKGGKKTVTRKVTRRPSRR